MLMILGIQGTANAWEIKTTNDGTPIRWLDGAVPIDLDFSAELYGIHSQDAEAATRAAFASWGTMVSSHLAIAFETGETGLGTGRDGLNVVRWGTDAADEFVDPVALGTTYLTYKTSTGQILEADIVVNGVDYEWTIVEGECSDRYDLQNILAHETGHLLGIAHSVDHKESTMYPSAGMCETKKRALATDDQEAISFLYTSIALEAPGSITEEFLGCQTSGGTGLWGALALLLALGAVRKRRLVAPLFLVAPSAALLLVANLGSADASTLFQLQPSELVTQADAIVQGVVFKQEVVLRNEQPMTVSTIAVSGCADGSCPATVTVVQLGGETPDIGLIVSGVHHLDVGREVILFLRSTKAGLTPVGRSQGIFEVSRVKGAEIVTRDLRGSVLTRSGEAKEGSRKSMRRTQFDDIFGRKLLKYKAP
tara:strand:- start:219492 stop:220763 length:1272 start_codon:yes stop_codon:yes gene_type:complete